MLATILTVGKHTGARPQAEQLVAALTRRLAVVADRVAGRRRPSVAVIEWTDPPFTAGHWVPDLVAAAGGRAVASRPGGRSEQTTWEQIAAARPEVVVVAPCGFHLDAAAAQAEVVARELPGLPVWAIDADGLVVRPGPASSTGSKRSQPSFILTHQEPQCPLAAFAAWLSRYLRVPQLDNSKKRKLSGRELPSLKVEHRAPDRSSGRTARSLSRPGPRR